MLHHSLSFKNTSWSMFGGTFDYIMNQAFFQCKLWIVIGLKYKGKNSQLVALDVMYECLALYNKGDLHET